MHKATTNKQFLAPAEIHTFIASHETRHWEAQRWCYDQDDLEVQGETTRVATQSAPTIGLENMEVDNFCHGPLGHEQSFPTKHILLLNSFGLIDCRRRVALTNTSPLQVHISSTLTTSKQLSAPFQAQKGVRLEHPWNRKNISCLFQLKANDFLFSTILWLFSWSDDLNECQFWRFLSQRKQLPPRCYNCLYIATGTQAQRGLAASQ